MTPWRGRLAILAVLLLTACHSYKNEDYAAMNTIPMNMVCVGRMLIALPKGAQSWQQQFDYGKVNKLPNAVNSNAAFAEYIETRRTVLSHPTDKSPQGRLAIDEKSDDNTIILQYRDRVIPDAGLHTERYVWLGHWGYKYETGGVFNNEAAILLSRIKDISDHVFPINNSHPPDRPGFCIDSALVTGDTGIIIVDTSVHVQGWPGVRVGMGIRADDGTRAPLPWQSTKGTSAPITAFEVLEMKQSAANARRHADEANQVVSFEVLRKRERTIAGLTGQEAAYRQELANGQQYYDFNWVSSGNQSGTDELNIAIDLRAGRGQFNPRYKAPPPEDDLLALWDAMLDSLKPRVQE